MKTFYVAFTDDNDAVCVDYVVLANSKEEAFDKVCGSDAHNYHVEEVKDILKIPIFIASEE